MAFFDVNDKRCDVAKIESKVLDSLKGRNVPLEKESEFVDRYTPDYFLETHGPSLLFRFKLFCSNLPRWMIVIFKVLPFYKMFRRRLKIEPWHEERFKP
ncbi:MAG: hypothetical protein ACE5GQ_02300 [Nitrospinales bacterium]